MLDTLNKFAKITSNRSEIVAATRILLVMMIINLLNTLVLDSQIAVNITTSFFHCGVWIYLEYLTKLVLWFIATWQIYPIHQVRSAP